MIDYHTFCEIKHLYNEKKLSSHKIGKILGIDEKTVSRWAKRDRFTRKLFTHRKSVLVKYKDRIDNLLKECSEYSAQQIFQILTEEGYTGSYGTISHYVGKIKTGSKKAYFTLNFEPGEAAQVDFAYCGMLKLNNTSRKYYAFIMTLCYSRMMYVEFIFHQNQEHFLQCHRNAFEYFSGVPQGIMVDNCKVAVIEHKHHEAAKLNPHYLDFALHYGFNIKACGVRKPNEKGQVEKAVDYLKGNFLRGKKDITSLEAVNNACRSWMNNIANVRKHRTTQKRPVDMFETEKKELGRINILPYDCATIKTVKANSQFRVVIDSNRYSVPADFASTLLTAKIYPSKLLFYHNDNLIAEHRRSYEKNMDFENPDHIKKLIEHKKNARDQKLMSSFLQISSRTPEYYAGLKNKRFNTKNHIRKILALFETYGKEKTSAAIEDALELEAFSSEYIANLLEQRERFTALESPLHLMRNKDCLELELEPTDIELYSLFEEE